MHATLSCRDIKLPNNSIKGGYGEEVFVYLELGEIGGDGLEEIKTYRMEALI